MGEDQDPEVARRLDEPGRGDRLPGSSRVAEAVAARGARVLARERRLVGPRRRSRRRRSRRPPRRARRRRSRPARPRARCRSRCRSPPPARWFDAISSVSMPGERVDLMPPQLGARGGRRRRRREHALEAEHEPVADAPADGRGATARLHLGERVVEGAAPRGAGRQRGSGILTGVEERLAVPGVCAERGGFQALCRLRRRWCRVEVGLVAYAQHAAAVLLSLRIGALYAFLARRAVLWAERTGIGVRTSRRSSQRYAQSGGPRRAPRRPSGRGTASARRGRTGSRRRGSGRRRSRPPTRRRPRRAGDGTRRRAPRGSPRRSRPRSCGAVAGEHDVHLAVREVLERR